MAELAKNYEPKKYEAAIYKRWEDSGAFKPSGKGEPFCIIMPPPNANGELHWGHAVGYSLEDAVTRYKRMQGFDTLWLPGTDHAGIETQFVFERDVLKPAGKSRADLGPEKFYEEVMAFTKDKQKNILDRFRAMGFSADWSRLKFTLDEDIIDIVYDTFIKMHKDGHVYRGNRIVNWCPHCQAAFADIEVERKDQTDDFYTLQYGPFQIATARPETKFGDKYVVMHPKDKRYAKYKEGDTFEAEWINGKVQATVIKDDAIDPEFGTGVMTITPWHDATDFEIAQHHKLDKEQIIDFEGNLLAIADEFTGMPIAKARPKIVDKLKAKGLLVKTEQRQHAIGVHDRCGNIIEPQISLQWFLKVKQLNQPVIKAFEEEIEMFPGRFTKIALNWLSQEHDWCISRQVWWGIRIPVYYKTSQDDEKDDYLIAKTEAEAEKYYGQGNYRAETDTFDTWFSSGQWPYATLMTTGDFDKFYPTALMATAREILHKWVTRMVMFGTYRIGKVPFRRVYLWGLVTDEHGQKMSKSKGNVIDPGVITDKYGTDALRLAGAISNTAGNDSPMAEARVEAMRNFNNKLWNVARFVISQVESGKSKVESQPEAKSLADKWIVHRLDEATKEVTSKFDQYRLNEAANAVYHLLWDDFADWYIEASKQELNPDVLYYGLETILKLAHPFVPFITEAIWQELPKRESDLIVSDWPKPGKSYTTEAKTFEQLQQVVSEVRNLKAELNLAKPSLQTGPEFALVDHSDLIKRLAGLESVAKTKEGSGLPLLTAGGQAWLQIEPAKLKVYQSNLKAKLEELQKRVDDLKKQLANKAFISSAPKDVVAARKTDLDEVKKQLALLNQQLKNFS